MRSDVARRGGAIPAAARRVVAAATLVAATLLAPGAIAAPLAPFDARYEVVRNGEPMGEATIALADAGDGTWTLRTTTEATRGLASVAGAHVDERSTFRWRDGRPELVRYHYEQKIGWKSKQRSLDARGGTIASDDGKHRGDLRFEPGVQDRHTIVLALAADLAAGNDDLRYRVADKQAVDEQRYEHGGRESVTVPAGTFDAERVERVRSKPGRTTTSWLAPSLGYRPVRIVQREPDGETLEMRLVTP